MEMQQLRYFLAICDKGTFTRAAQSVYVAQPSLTQSIKKLEVELGGELFVRDRSGCRLTALGRLVEPGFREILQEANTIKAEATRFNRLKKVPIRIGVMSTISAHHLSPFFASYQFEFPQVELELIIDNEKELLNQLSSDSLDLVISAPTTIKALPYQLNLLYEERYVVVFNNKHRFNQMQEIDLISIESEPYLDRLNCELREKLQSVCKYRQIDLYAAYRSNSEEWILNMVRAGIGVALVPEFTVPEKDDKLRYRYLSDPEINRKVYAIMQACVIEKPETQEVLNKLHVYFSVYSSQDEPIEQ